MFLLIFLLVFGLELGGKRVTFDLNLWEESYQDVQISLDSKGDFWRNRTYTVNFEAKKRINSQSGDLGKDKNKIYTEFRSPDGKRTGIRMVCSSGSVCWFISFQGGHLHQISKFHRGGVSVHNKEPWQIIQFDREARIDCIQTKILNATTKKLYKYKEGFLKRIEFLVDDRTIIQEKISHQGKHQIRREIFQRDYITGEFEARGSIVIRTTQDGRENYFYYDSQGDLLQFKSLDKQGNKTMEIQDSLEKKIFYGYTPLYTTRQQQIEMDEGIESISSRTELPLEEESWDFESFSDCNTRECTTSGGEKVRFFSPSYEHWVTTWGGNEREKTTLYTPISIEEIYEKHKKTLTYESDGSTVFKRFFYPVSIPYGMSKTIWSEDGLPLEKVHEKSHSLYFYGDRDGLEDLKKRKREKIFALDSLGIYEILQQFLLEKIYPKDKIDPFLGYLKNFIEVNHKKQIFLDKNGRVIRYSRWKREKSQKGSPLQSGFCLSVRFYVGPPDLKYLKSGSILDFVEDGLLLANVNVLMSQDRPKDYGGWNEFLTQVDDRVDPELENLNTKVFLRIERDLLEELTITQYTPDGLIYAEKRVTRAEGLEPRKDFLREEALRETDISDKFFSSFEDSREARVELSGS